MPTSSKPMRRTAFEACAKAGLAEATAMPANIRPNLRRDIRELSTATFLPRRGVPTHRAHCTMRVDCIIPDVPESGRSPAVRFRETRMAAQGRTAPCIEQTECGRGRVKTPRAKRGVVEDDLVERAIFDLFVVGRGYATPDYGPLS